MVWDLAVAPDRSCNHHSSDDRSRGSSRGRETEKILFDDAEERYAIDAFLDQLAKYAVIDAPLVFAETGTGVLPCVNGPGRINPRREDGEGVSSRIRIRDEGLIGEMGSYGSDGYMGLPTDRPTRQEFTDPTSMVTTLDSECSGTYVIGGLEDFDFIVPRRDLQDACRRPTTPDTHSYGKSGGFDTAEYTYRTSTTPCDERAAGDAHRSRRQRGERQQRVVIVVLQSPSVAKTLPEDHEPRARLFDDPLDEAGCPHEGRQSTLHPTDGK